MGQQGYTFTRWISTIVLGLLLVQAQGFADNTDLWQNYYDQGKTELKAKHFDAAQKLIMLALLEAQKDSQDSKKFIRTLDQLARYYYETAQWKEAENTLLKILDLKEHMFGKTHPSYFYTLDNLILCYLASQNLEAAQIELTWALPAAEEVLGPEDKTVFRLKRYQEQLSERLKVMTSTETIKMLGNGDLKSYSDDLIHRIRQNWRPPKLDSDKTLTARFEVSRDGTLVEMHIEQSSDELVLDKTALEAIEKAAPFSPLPKDYADKSVTIEMMFQYFTTE